MTDEQAARLLDVNLYSLDNEHLKRAFNDAVKKYSPEYNPVDFIERMNYSPDGEKYRQIIEANKILKTRLNRFSYDDNYSFSSPVSATMENVEDKNYENVIKETVESVLKENGDELDEVIPGTDIHRPRPRKDNETYEQYSEFLKNYYEQRFTNVKNRDGINDVQNLRKNIKTEKEKLPILEQEQNRLKEEFQKVVDSENIFQLSNMAGNMNPDDFHQKVQEFTNKKQALKEKLFENQKVINSITENIAKDETDLDNLINKIAIESPEKQDIKGIEAPKSKELAVVSEKELAPIEPAPALEESIPKDEKSVYNEQNNLEGILDYLTDGLDFKAKDGYKYTWANVKVKQAFYTSIHEQNVAYNIVGVIPGAFNAVISGVKKLISKTLYKVDIQKRVNDLKERLSKLSENDLQILFEQYRGNTIVNHGFPDIVNKVISERLHVYADNKIKEIQGQIAGLYDDLFKTWDKIKSITSNEPKTEEEKKHNDEEIKNISLGKAQEVRKIRELQNALRDRYLSGGGLHGMDEDIKASNTKMSLPGKRFAKTNDLNHDLQHQAAEYSRQEEAYINNNMDKEALLAFFQNEKLYSDNTVIKNTPLGKVSVGDKFYTPLGEKLDYRDDPFVKNLFSSIAIGTSVAAGINSIANNIKIERANELNNQNMNMAHNIGGKETSMGDTFAAGQKANAQQANLSGFQNLERKSLDANDWNIASAKYHTMDQATHETFGKMYENTQNAYASIAKDYVNKTLDSATALGKVTEISNKVQESANNIYNGYLPIIKSYAATHPQFDLSTVTGGLDYLTKNASAIAKSNLAQVEVLKYGEALKNLQAVDAPSDLISTLAAAGSSLAFVAAASKNLQDNMNRSNNNTEIQETIKGMTKEELEHYREMLIASHAQNGIEDGRNR